MTRPKLTKQEAIALLGNFYLPGAAQILGIRGYYKKSMGESPLNERGIYDDAIFLITPDLFLACNGNTDPSIHQAGIAVLQPGQWWFKKGLHGMRHFNLSKPYDKTILDKLLSTGKDVPEWGLTYWAFRQAGNVTVMRDGGKLQTDTAANRFWIDLHMGGEWRTSSLGCQTIIRDEWENFRDVGYAAMDKCNQTKISYLLIEQ